ncbi:MAG: hypothetical protein WDA75_26305 [Candidatus Latescibacterota bacterium]
MNSTPSLLPPRSPEATASLLQLSPHELLEKQAALEPPPRLHLIHYHGVLTLHAADRVQIVLGAATTLPADAAAPISTCLCWRSWACRPGSFAPP